MKAIETIYKGYRFRSRLEARWAVFFDALGVRYKYEEYGFEKNISCDGDPAVMVRWLPDFYLPDHGMWVEVKGGSPSQNDAEKMSQMLDYGSPLAFFDDSECIGYSAPKPEWMFKNGREMDPLTSMYREMGGDPGSYMKFLPGLLLLGDVPQVNHGIAIHPFVTHAKGLQRHYGYFAEDQFVKMGGAELSMFLRFYGGTMEDIGDGDFLDATGSGPEEKVMFFTPDVHAAESRLAYTKACAAYRAARSARFEHGESPDYAKKDQGWRRYLGEGTA